MDITMGNFFSGSGTWELAAKICGIKVLFESEIEKFPVELEAKRFPEAIQLGDISKVDGRKIPAVDILTNSSPCFAGDSLVRTADGMKAISEVKVGDYVLTHAQVFRKVMDSGCTGHKAVMKLKAMGIDEIIATPNHPFYVRHCKKRYPTKKKGGKRIRVRVREFSEPEWIPMHELSKTDMIGIPVYDGEIDQCPYSDEELWLIGRYIADGYRRKDQATVIFCVGKAKIQEFRENLNSYKGYEFEDRTAIRYGISNKKLYEVCGECGDGAENKHFPGWAYRIGKNKLKVLFDGYMSGDGCRKSTGLYSATTISRKLACDLQFTIIRLFGIPCRLYFTKRNETYVIEGRTVNQRDTYSVVFSPNTSIKDKAFYENGYVWLPVREVKEFGEADVYNLTVDGDESYTVQNIAVHNCQDLSVAGLRAGLDGARSGLFGEVIRITKEMRE